MPPKRVRIVPGTCQSCKSRRALCDLQKPKCGKCISAGLQCEYGTQYKWTGVAARGRFAKQSVPTASPSYALVPRDCRGWQGAYFQQEIVPRFGLTYRGIKLEPALVAREPVLLDAMKALAHAHKSINRPPVSRDSLVRNNHARLSAIQAFRSRLQESDPPNSTVFFANVVLGMLDGIIEPLGDEMAIAAHFAGGKAILNTCSDVTVMYEQRTGIQSLLISIFASMDLTSSIIGGEEPPYFDHQWWEEYGDREAWWSGLECEDKLVRILGMLAELAGLGHLAREGAPALALDHLLALQLGLEQIVLPKSQQNPASTPMEQVSASYSEGEGFCAAFKATAYIYLYRTLCNLDCSHYLVQNSVKVGVQAIRDANVSGKIAHCLVFPILVIGSHCKDPAMQQELLEIVREAARSLRFGSIHMLDEFLQNTWQITGDFNWWAHFGPISRRAFIF